MVNDPCNKFNPEEHCFVSPHKKLCDELGNHNVICTSKKRISSMINFYGKYCDWIFLHGYSLSLSDILIKPKFLTKIIWRTWGHDIGYFYKRNEPFKNLLKRLLNFIRKFVIKKFYAIGIANTVDKISVERFFGKIKTYRMPYPVKVENNIQAFEQIKENDCVNVLLGHSGFSNDNHIKILEKLKVYSNKNMRVYIPLAYGDVNYIEKIKEYVSQENLSFVTILDKFIKVDEYVKFLNSIDIAIFDGTNSYALGNIAWLLKFNKKFYLNKTGIIREAFTMENIPYICVDEIGNITYEEFVKTIDYSEVATDMRAKTYEENIIAWQLILKDMDKQKTK